MCERAFCRLLTVAKHVQVTAPYARQLHYAACAWTQSIKAKHWLAMRGRCCAAAAAARGRRAAGVLPGPCAAGAFAAPGAGPAQPRLCGGQRRAATPGAAADAQPVLGALGARGARAAPAPGPAGLPARRAAAGPGPRGHPSCAAAATCTSRCAGMITVNFALVVTHHCHPCTLGRPDLVHNHLLSIYYRIPCSGEPITTQPSICKIKPM